jgi:acyl-CoA reductase LuxC
VLVVDDLLDVISKFDGTMQTLGLGIGDAKREEVLARAAGRNGVDRIVKLGRMHVFGSPWDGTELIRPLVRLVRHVQSQD